MGNAEHVADGLWDSPDEAWGLEVAGARDIRDLPLSALAVLPQIRRTYDPEAMSALAESMDDGIRHGNDRRHLVMVHPPKVNLLDRQKAMQFLHDHAEYEQMRHPIPIESLPQFDNDTFLIVISGNTRVLTTRAQCVERGAQEDLTLLPCSVEIGLTFAEANRLQALENTYAAPSPHDIAHRIKLEREHRMRMQGRVGLRPDTDITHAAIARHFGYSTARVADALKYVELPMLLQKQVEAGSRVTYSVALSFYPLVVALRQKFDIETEDPLVIDTVQSLVNKFCGDDLSTGQSTQKLAEVIAARVNALTPDKTGQEALIPAEYSTAVRENRKQSARRLARKAVMALRMVSSTDPDALSALREEDRSALLSLAARLGAEALQQELDAQSVTADQQAIF